jgi:lysozyme
MQTQPEIICKEPEYLPYSTDIANDFIKFFEGRYIDKKNNMHRAYLDPVGVWTVGYGHVIIVNGKMCVGVNSKKKGIIVANFESLPINMQFLSEEAANDMLARDLRYYYNKIIKMVKYSLNNYEIAALMSFCYNVGLGNFRISRLFRLINYNQFGDEYYDSIMEAFLRFNKAGGMIFKGLTKRRIAECRLFYGQYLLPR